METIIENDTPTNMRVNVVRINDNCTYYIRDNGKTRRTIDWREARDYIMSRVETTGWLIENILDEMEAGRMNYVSFQLVD